MSFPLHLTLGVADIYKIKPLTGSSLAHVFSSEHLYFSAIGVAISCAASIVYARTSAPHNLFLVHPPVEAAADRLALATFKKCIGIKS